MARPKKDGTETAPATPKKSPTQRALDEIYQHAKGIVEACKTIGETTDQRKDESKQLRNIISILSEYPALQDFALKTLNERIKEAQKFGILERLKEVAVSTPAPAAAPAPASAAPAGVQAPPPTGSASRRLDKVEED